MKDLLLVILIGVTAYLGYDNYSKRGALKSAQQEIQRLSANRDQPQASAGQTQQHLQQNPIRARSYAPAPSNPPAWFQERLNQRPSLDEAVRHRHAEEDTTRSTRYGSGPSATPY